MKQPLSSVQLVVKKGIGYFLLQVESENATKLRIKGLALPLAYLPAEGPEEGWAEPAWAPGSNG